MTIERALDVSSAAAATGAATFVALAKGTGMDQWLMWVLSTVVAASGAYGAFRLTTENRLTAVEQRLETTATKVDIATVEGQISQLQSEAKHRHEVMDRMDARIEKIAQRMGVM